MALPLEQLEGVVCRHASQGEAPLSIDEKSAQGTGKYKSLFGWNGSVPFPHTK